MSYWSGVRNKQPRTIREFRGVNKLDRFSIGPLYAMSTKNLTSTKFPALTTRPGLSILGSAIGTKVLGLGVWKDTELHAVFNDGTWRKWTGAAWTTLLSGLNTSAECTFTNFKGGLSGINLFMTNGVDTMSRYDGSTVTLVAGAPAGANYITQFADRLWCAVGNELKASAYRIGTDWSTVSVPEQDTDSWYTIIETPDGETINGIHAGLSKLTITKPSSIHHLYGYAPSDYEVRIKTTDYGAFNHKSVVAFEGQLHMLDPNGISKYAGGLLPDSGFSYRVQDYIDNINQTAKGTSCVGNDGLRLYVSIPVSSSTNPDTVLVYDPKTGKWDVWDNFSALHFAKLGNSFYIGDAAGKVHEITGTTDNGTAITWEYITGPIAAPSLAQMIRLMNAYVTANVPTGSAYSVYISPSDNGDDWTLIKSVSAGDVVESTSIHCAVTSAAYGRYYRIKLTGTGPQDTYELALDEEFYAAR